MNTLDTQYQNLLKDIIENGIKKGDRTGTGTISVFGRTIRHKMSEGFPLLTTKKMFTKGIITELIWFLKGDTNIKFLVDNGCHIWDGDAYKRYCTEFKKGNAPGLTLLVKRLDGDTPEQMFSKEEFIDFIGMDNDISGHFADTWGDLGSVYGKQWRRWTNHEPINDNGNYSIKTTHIDQIDNLINDLKNNPDSRRLMVNAWNVPEIPNCVLPPCHYGFQVWTRELTLEERVAIWDSKYLESLNLEDSMDNIDLSDIPKRAISLMWQQRSVDTFLGLPFNIASYGLLLEIIAKEVNMVPDELIGNLGDTHLYLNHIDQAKEQMGREPFSLPSLEIMTHDDQNFGCTQDLYIDNFNINNYQSHTKIEAPLSN